MTAQPPPPPPPDPVVQQMLSADVQSYAYLARSLFLVLLGGTLLVLAIRRLRQFRLRERYALLFLLIGLPFLVLAFWQEGVAWMAERLMVQYNTFAIICIAIFLFLAVFELLTIVSTQDRKITTLTQLVGILMEKQGLNDRLVRDDPHAATNSGTTRADTN